MFIKDTSYDQDSASHSSLQRYLAYPAKPLNRMNQLSFMSYPLLASFSTGSACAVSTSCRHTKPTQSLAKSHMRQCGLGLLLVDGAQAAWVKESASGKRYT